MQVTIIDSIYLSCIRNYIVGYQNVACGGCVGVLGWVAPGFVGCLGVGSWLGVESVTAGVFGVLGLWVGCRLGVNRARLRAPNTAPPNPCEVDMTSVACLAFPT